MIDLFEYSGPIRPAELRETLTRDHYLGPTNRGTGWVDEFGCLVLAAPTSRRLPRSWLELSRWCLRGVKNGGSKQWSRVSRWIRREMPEVTTVVSYSDPAAGHTGALYRACNWLWAPTWHRIVTPPTGNGSWDGIKAQAAKDRWIFPVKADRDRVGILELEPTYTRRFPWSEYREPGGADYKAFTQGPVATQTKDSEKT